MKRTSTLLWCGSGIWLAMCVQTTPSLQAQQGSFTLDFDGPAEIRSGSPGEAITVNYDATLTQADVPPPTDPGDPLHTGLGAQGWSISLTAENAEITSITTAGTAADTLANGGFWSGGFNKTQVTTGPANEGAVSAVILSFTEGNVLPDNLEYVIARLGVRAILPDVPTTARLLYRDGLRGAGQPVSNVVTVAGATVTPVLSEKSTRVGPIHVHRDSCCNERINVGFSAAPVRGGAPFEGIAGVDILNELEELCRAANGRIEYPVPSGQTGDASVYANIISRLPDDSFGLPFEVFGVQGWSFSIHLDGDIEFGSPGVTTDGTAADSLRNGGYWNGGFNKTLVVDPARNAGQRGCVSSVVLSFDRGDTLPPGGEPPGGTTESVLEINVRPRMVPTEPGHSTTGRLRFQDGLIGVGQPVSNVFTVRGNSFVACNADPQVPLQAQVEVTFAVIVNSIHHFVRGDANGDRKVNLADVIWILNELFHSGPATACQDAADGNNDGLVDASDATYLILYLFGKEPPLPGSSRQPGEPPPVPFPDCGIDPGGDGDALTCAASQELCF